MGAVWRAREIRYLGRAADTLGVVWVLDLAGSAGWAGCSTGPVDTTALSVEGLDSTGAAGGSGSRGAAAGIDGGGGGDDGSLSGRGGGVSAGRALGDRG